MSFSDKHCKVCGKWAKFDVSEFSEDLPTINKKYYCSRVCRDYDTWGFKIAIGSLLIVVGWILLLAASTDVTFAYFGFPMFIGGFGMVGWGIKKRRLWTIHSEDQAEIDGFIEGLNDLDEIVEID
ncbi:MAG: hypothetical protein ACC656_00765 [Candidatus Heimdallarchaeota archaeon]